MDSSLDSDDSSRLWPTDVLFPAAIWEDTHDLPVADIDWATGTMRLFTTKDEWETLLRAPRGQLAAHELFRLEAIAHETMHLLQFTLTGFGYTLSRDLFRAVARVVHDHPHIEDQYEHAREYSDGVGRALTSLDIEGESGITARWLFESSAFVVQKKTHYPTAPRPFVEDLINRQGKPEYREAYEVAKAHLFEEAFDHFNLLANLALMTRAPGKVFVPLLRHFAGRASRIDDRANYALGTEFLRGSFPELFLGSASAVRAQGSPHPILDRIIDRIAHLAETGSADTVRLIARGAAAANEAVAEALIGPILFLPDKEGLVAPMRIPDAWAAAAGTDALLGPGTLRFLTASSLLLQAAAVPDEPN